MEEIKKRKKAREFAKQSLSKNKPLDWFEKLYIQAKEGMAIIPWADFEPNPNLVEWFEKNNFESRNKTALKIGCGLGDDAEFLSQKGFSVTAFDISKSAIEWAKERFKNTKVNYIVADLFKIEESLKNTRFDFVVESYTLQVLPKKLRKEAIAIIANLVKNDGILLLITRARNKNDDEGQMPWPLLKKEILEFEKHQLEIVSFEDYFDNEEPRVRRFRVVFKKV